VAFGAAQAASTKEKDYIKNGFLARTRAEEIEAKGMTVRITESFRDVSQEVLSAVREGMELAERTKAIERRIKEIVAEEEKKNPGKRAEVAEMFRGKNYVLFLYTFLKDIRLVYVPPRSIGEFGGEVDNWMWPRHTGDFSFLRAYVAPDGSSAGFAPANVPFHPKRYLQVAPEGVKENDFVFLLGYPGTTYRHRTSHFLSYEQEVRLPYVAEWYAWQIAVMEKMGEADRGIALKHIARIKGLANTMKNYRGKLKGMKKLDLAQKKRDEEKALQSFIESDPKLKPQYGDVLESIRKIHEEMRGSAERELILGYLRSSVNLVGFGYTVYEASLELQKDDLDRESPYMERNFALTKQRLLLSCENYYEPTDRTILKELLLRAARLPQSQRIPAIDAILKESDTEANIDKFIAEAYSRSRLADKAVLAEFLAKSPADLKQTNDPFIKLAEALYPTYQQIKERDKARRGALDPLYAKLVEVKALFLKKDFIPDANNTLRLTYGRIRGYEPADSVFYRPITTLDGVIEKTTGEEPFDTPAGLIDLYRAKDFGRFRAPGLKSVPVCILYDTDTTGGNSGSPVLNARGELVGVNFDRTYEATINDFAWSEDWSRSIAVDIRYVLWVTEKFGGADFLLREMKVQLE
jgi:hypothetical protein